MFQRLTVILLAAACLALAGCSASAPATGPDTAPEEPESVSGPAWFEGETLRSESGVFHAGAAALGADSSEAAGRAVRRARQVLESEVSARLDSLRRQVAEGNGEAGLSDPAFILDLRRAEAGVGREAGLGRLEAAGIENGRAWRAFARVSLPESALIERLDAALSSHTIAWPLLKGAGL